MKCWVILLTFGLFASCTRLVEKCSPLQTIFYQKSEPYIEVFTMEELMQMADSTQTRLCDENYFWSEVAVSGLSIPAEMWINGSCNRLNNRGCFFGRPKTEIRMEKEEIFLNGNLVDLDSLKDRFQNHFYALDTIKGKKWQKSTVILNCKEVNNAVFINSVIYEIAKGYSKGLLNRMTTEGKPFSCEHYEKKIKNRRERRLENKEDIVQYDMPLEQPFLLSIELDK